MSCREYALPLNSFIRMDRRTFLSRQHEELTRRYLKTCAGPALAALAAIPTLACAERAEPPPIWPQLPLSPLYLLQHFAYGRGSHPYTVLTSLLLVSRDPSGQAESTCP